MLCNIPGFAETLVNTIDQDLHNESCFFAHNEIVIEYLRPQVSYSAVVLFNLLDMYADPCSMKQVELSDCRRRLNSLTL